MTSIVVWFIIVQIILVCVVVVGSFMFYAGITGKGIKEPDSHAMARTKLTFQTRGFVGAFFVIASIAGSITLCILYADTINIMPQIENYPKSWVENETVDVHLKLGKYKKLIGKEIPVLKKLFKTDISDSDIDIGMFHADGVIYPYFNIKIPFENGRYMLTASFIIEQDESSNPVRMLNDNISQPNFNAICIENFDTHFHGKQLYHDYWGIFLEEERFSNYVLDILSGVTPIGLIDEIRNDSTPLTSTVAESDDTLRYYKYLQTR